MSLTIPGKQVFMLYIGWLEGLNILSEPSKRSYIKSPSLALICSFCRYVSNRRNLCSLISMIDLICTDSQFFNLLGQSQITREAWDSLCFKL
jgi:hypothetical protein